jgi:hypothetical protein
VKVIEFVTSVDTFGLLARLGLQPKETFTMSKAEMDIKRKLRVFRYAEKVGGI